MLCTSNANDLSLATRHASGSVSWRVIAKRVLCYVDTTTAASLSEAGTSPDTASSPVTITATESALTTGPHRYGNSHATWDHTVLPATRQSGHSRHYPQPKLVLDLAIPDGCKAELT